MSFLTSSKQSSDELSSYMGLSISKDDINLLKTSPDNGIIAFWLSKRQTFPKLHRHALRNFITPASSTPIERDFSLLKLLVTPGKSRLKDDIVNAVGVLRSAISIEEDW